MLSYMVQIFYNMFTCCSLKDPYSIMSFDVSSRNAMMYVCPSTISCAVPQSAGMLSRVPDPSPPYSWSLLSIAPVLHCHRNAIVIDSLMIGRI